MNFIGNRNTCNHQYDLVALIFILSILVSESGIRFKPRLA